MRWFLQWRISIYQEKKLNIQKLSISSRKRDLPPVEINSNQSYIQVAKLLPQTERGKTRECIVTYWFGAVTRSVGTEFVPHYAFIDHLVALGHRRPISAPWSLGMYLQHFLKWIQLTMCDWEKYHFCFLNCKVWIMRDHCAMVIK